MTWLRAIKETGRSGLTIERKPLRPLVALRGAAGLAIVIVVSLWAFGPTVAAGSAFGAFQAAIATFQSSWRPRPELALASGTSLGVSTFLGYLTGAHTALFLLLLVVWTFLAGLGWAAGPTIGFIASTNVAMMLVTITLPTSLADAAGHGGAMIAGGVVQAALVVLFPIRRWGAHRDVLADALAAEADYARRLGQDPVAAFDPQPLMQARSAAALTPRQARTRPAELHGARGVAERIRPVLAALADPAVGAAREGRERERVRELLDAAAAILDAAAGAIRGGTHVVLPPNAVAAFKTPDTGAILKGPAHRAAKRLGVLLRDVVEVAGGTKGDSGLPRREPAPAPTTEGTVSPQIPAPRAPSPQPLSQRPPAPGPASATGQDRPPTETDTAQSEPHTGTGPGPGAPVTETGTEGGRTPGEAGPEQHRATTESGPAPGEPRPRARRVRGGANGEGQGARPPRPATALRRPTVLGLLPSALRALRAEARNGGSPVTRHAVRVAAVAGAGYVIGAVLPFGHGYWAPMAAVMVMRPDFSQTFSRAVARFGGTLVGVVLATGVGQVLTPGVYLAAALAVVCAGLMYLLLSAGQVAVQACIAAYVVFLLGMAGEHWTQTVPERVLLTLVGGVLAMLAYAVYPAWETPRLRMWLAGWLSTNGSYAAAVLDRHAAPAESDRQAVRTALLTTRDARIAWQEAEARAAHEPVRHRGLSPAAAEAAGRSMAQFSRVAMLMEAHLPDRSATPLPGAARVADALRTATEEGAKAVRERRVPRWDAVRAALDEWDPGIAARPTRAGGVPPRDVPPREAEQLVRRGVGLLLAALEELSAALGDSVAASPESADRPSERSAT